jgi:2-phosphosulfolactate phosphatase
MQLVRKQIEVCFSPALYHRFYNPDGIVVVVDILRATSAICAAFMNGVEKIIPVSTLEEAQNYKKQGYLIAAERDGIVCDFADFGNSPFNFNHNNVEGKEIVYSTTNGTQAIHLAKNSYKIIIGSFLNLKAITDYLINENRDILILCAGWKDRFSLEDSVYAGALVEKMLSTKKFTTTCDSAFAASDLWLMAKNNLTEYIQKAAQRERLRKNGLDDVIEYCHTLDITDIVPVYANDAIYDLKNVDIINHFC